MLAGDLRLPKICFLHLICFWLHVFVSLVFSVCFLLGGCLLVWLLSSFGSLSFFLFVSVSVYVSVCHFVCLVFLLPVALGFCLFLCLGLFVCFLPCPVACRVLVLRLGVRPEPVRWESRVQDVGTSENSQPH